MIRNWLPKMWICLNERQLWSVRFTPIRNLLIESTADNIWSSLGLAFDYHLQLLRHSPDKQPSAKQSQEPHKDPTKHPAFASMPAPSGWARSSFSVLIRSSLWAFYSSCESVDQKLDGRCLEGERWKRLAFRQWSASGTFHLHVSKCSDWLRDIRR